VRLEPESLLRELVLPEFPLSEIQVREPELLVLVQRLLAQAQIAA